MVNTCRTNLLSDSPVSEDAFGGHQRVAEAIAALVQEEEGGKAIALSGGWGSGKSTVVKLMESSLKSPDHDKDTMVFTFDAWAHQGDPLRRSFLEQLLDSLREWGAECGDKWKKNIKDKITNRLKTSKTTRYPKLTLAGILFAISTLMVPIGMTPISDDLNFPFWLRLVLVLMPASMIVILLVLERFKIVEGFKIIWNKIKGQNREKDTNKKKFSFFTMIVSDGVQEEFSETIESPNPTSIEFQSYFEEILEKTLGIEKNRRLVIVIDNLDRVNNDDALSIWSTMRTFFEWPDADNPTWLSRLWLLVPFDRDALTRLWNSNGESDRVNAFIDKSFQVEFHVSPPILSDWKKYFIKQLGTAFPDHADNSNEFETIYRLYDFILTEKALPPSPPSPRDIKILINKAGAIHRQWQDKIPLIVLFLYVLKYQNRRDKTFNECIIKNNHISQEEILILNIEEWKKYLAAIHYNVDTEKALEVLIGETVNDSFSKGEPEKLNMLLDIPGFQAVCHQVIENNWTGWANSSSGDIALAGFTLNRISSVSKEWNSSWQCICQGVENIFTLNNINERAGQGFASIIDHSLERTPEIAKIILLRLSNFSILNDFSAISEFNKDNIAYFNQTFFYWTDACIQVIEKLHHDNMKDLIQDNFRVSGSEKAYVFILALLHKKKVNGPFLDYFQTSVSPESTVNELVRIYSNGNFLMQYSGCVEVMVDMKTVWPWPKFIGLLNHRIPNGKPDELKYHLHAMLVLAYKAQNSDAKQALKILSRESCIQDQLNHVKNDPKALALCIFPIFVECSRNRFQSFPNIVMKRFNGILARVPSSDKKLRDDFLSAFIDLLLEFQKIDILLQYGQVHPDPARAILEKIIQRDDMNNHLTAEIVMDNFDSIFTNLNLPDKLLLTLVNKLIKQGDLITLLKKSEFTFDWSQLYYWVIQTDNNLDEFIPFLIEKLQKIDTPKWLNELSSGNLFSLKVIQTLVDKNVSLNLGHFFQKALSEHSKDILSGKTEPPNDTSVWAKLPGALERDSYDFFIKNIWDRILSSDNSLETIFELYGNLLIEHDYMIKKSDEIVRNVFMKIIDRKSETELEWLKSALKTRQDLFEKSDESTRNVFEDTIKQSFPDRKISDLLNQIDQIIGGGNSMDR